MRDLVIIGAGGHGRETLDIVEAINAETPTWSMLGFLDDGSPDLALVVSRGSRVIGPIDRLPAFEGSAIVAIGGGPARRAVVDRLASESWRPATLVHPSAVVGAGNRLGADVLVAAACVVTTNVTIGDHTHLNARCSVHHDCTIGDVVTLSPGVIVNGEVQLGDDVWIGPGAVIGRGITVGAGAVIGAGAVVLHDVPPGCRVAGIPARDLGDRRRGAGA